MTSKPQMLSDSRILIAGSIIFLSLLFLSDSSYLATLRAESSTLKGQGGPNDIAQDIVGFRAIVKRQDPYPILGPAFRNIGIMWGDVDQASTHPPTAFLLVAPIAMMPWKLASAIWAWLMVFLLVVAFRCYKISWKAAADFAMISLLWPPVATSLHQLTIIWLLGIVASRYFEERLPIWSGVGIGLASLTKYLPGIMIFIFFIKRQWRALFGFVTVWVVSLLALVLFHPNVLYRYIEVNQKTSPFTIQRSDNLSLLVSGYRACGWLGVALVLLLLFSIIWANKDCFRNQGPASAHRVWDLFSYLSVALLPICWVYSLVPLLPTIISLISRKKLSTMAIGYFCIVVPCCCPIWGDASVFPLQLVILFAGIGLYVDGLHYGIFTATTFKELIEGEWA